MHATLNTRPTFYQPETAHRIAHELTLSDTGADRWGYVVSAVNSAGYCHIEVIDEDEEHVGFWTLPAGGVSAERVERAEYRAGVRAAMAGDRRRSHATQGGCW